MFAVWRRKARQRRYAATGRGAPPPRRMQLERLEDRTLLAAAPFGALPDDTAEYMLGDVLVSVVLMESSETTTIFNPNSETWTPQTIEAAKQKVVDGMTWWEQTLANEFPAAAEALRFQYDFTYADQPVLTAYEPIHNPSSYFQYWIYDFLNHVGHGLTGNFTRDIRAFNHAQRLAHGTDWAFTVFVVNDTNDADGMFGGGPFLRAFAYAGGQFLVSPAGRPASTFAHEAGHMFWARDEYQGGGNYTDRRGYYNAPNSNAWDNPAPGFVQSPSIMARDELTTSPPRPLLSTAWADRSSSTSSLEMIGWRDSDGNGILDVVDVPHALSGGGYYDPQAEVYRFQGTSAVRTLPNQNSSGLQSDITINRIGRAEYRLDGGLWQTAAVYTPAAEIVLNLAIPVPAAGLQTIEIRTIDERTQVTSDVFVGRTDQLAAVLKPGINGFVWNDENQNGQYDAGEQPLPGWTVRVVDAAGQPLQLAQHLEPDLYADGTRLDQVNAAATLRAFVNGSWRGVVAVTSNLAATGSRVLGYLDSSGASQAAWDKNSSLRIDFSNPVTAVRLDAIGSGAAQYARLAIYNAQGELLQRVTTGPLGSGQVETMSVERGRADIAYAIASQHGESTILLDNLRIGPETAAVTDAWGGYSLPALPPDTYRVQAVAPPFTQLADPILTVVVPEGEAAGSISPVGSVNFAAQQLQISWQNPLDPADVTGDGLVTPMDVLTVINYINGRDGDYSLPSPPAAPPPYYDVDGNGYVTATDVLIVINRLNQPDPETLGAVDAGEPDGGPVADGGGPAEGEAARLRSVAGWLANEPRAAVRSASSDLAAPSVAASDSALPRAPQDWRTPHVDHRRLANGRTAASPPIDLTVAQNCHWDAVLLDILPELAVGDTNSTALG